MSFFNARLRYALCAVVDLALQPPLQSCQSREIATRQGIPGPYLDQILAALKSAGIVRSVRGAGGGYNLSRSPSKITAGEIVKAMMRGDQLFASGEEAILESSGAEWVVHELEERVEQSICSILESVTLEDLAQRKVGLDENLAIMPSI